MNFILIVTLLSLVVPTKKALHMFQQNRYEATRFSMWISDYLKTNVRNIILAIFFVGLAFNLGILINTNFAALVIAYYSLSIIQNELNEEYIKPLVYTHRVIRQIITIIVLYGLLIFFVYKLDFNFSVYLMLASPFIPYLTIYIMHIITYPIEAYVRSLYKKSAIKILNSNPFLIKVGITGSYGKTSTKNILNEILSEQFYSLATPASFNTPMGITITIREQLKNLHEVFIVEMGADKLGDIVELSDFVRPKYAMITSIGPQHLATFKSIDNIINEKMALAEKLPHDGIAILNYDNEYIRNYKFKNIVNTISYGIENKDVDYLACNIKYSIEGSQFDVKYKDEIYHFKTRLLGEHNVLNILGAIALGRVLNINWENLIVAVNKVKFIAHRLELKAMNGRIFIDNAFNSNPEGANMSLKVLSMMDNKRYIVTPGMIDLGVIQQEENYKFGFNMKDKVDVVLLVGKNQTKPIYEGLSDANFNMDNVIVFNTVKEALAFVYKDSTIDDIILLENDLPDAFSN